MKTRDQKRKLKHSLSQWKTAEMASRQCPKCRRKGAISKIDDGDSITKWCRYKDCDYESFRYYPI